MPERTELEQQLALLQPPPKAPAPHNLLKKANVQLASKRKERSTALQIKETLEKEIEERN